MRGVLCIWLTACVAEPDPCAGRRDLGASPAGLALTEAEHPEGWGRTACLQCHPVGTVHQADCIAGVAVDVAEIDPNEDCAVCHGDNGARDGDS